MASPVWNKTRRLWIIQAQKNGIKKTFYSSLPGQKGKREAMQKYDEWLEFGGVTSITVSRCIELYLQDIEARLGRRDTYREAEIYSRLYIIPLLGRSKMDNLSLRDWQRVLNEAKPQNGRTKELSHKTLLHLRSVCTGLHKFAYINYYCEEWRGSLYIPQGHKKGERQILQPSDIAKLFEPSDLWYINAFRIQLLCGLRPGEALALQEGDIKDGLIYISRSINDEGQITSGKNANARRCVPLPPIAEALIKETIERNHKARFNTAWIFPNGCGGQSSQTTYRKQWNRLKAEKGLPGSPYSLRHTFVSIVSSQTHITEGTLRQLVGHSKSMDTFGVYKHEVSGEIESASRIINLTFERLKDAK